MLLLVLILVLLAFGLLVVALLTGNVIAAWVSVGLSMVAALVLLVDWLQRRSAIKAGAASMTLPGADRASDRDHDPRRGRAHDPDPATEILPVVPPSGSLPGKQPAGGQYADVPGHGTVDDPTMVAAVPHGEDGSPADDRDDAGHDGPGGSDTAQRTVMMGAFQPSGSSARPSGADQDFTASSGSSSRSVTNYGPGEDLDAPAEDAAVADGRGTVAPQTGVDSSTVLVDTRKRTGAPARSGAGSPDDAPAGERATDEVAVDTGADDTGADDTGADDTGADDQDIGRPVEPDTGSVAGRDGQQGGWDHGAATAGAGAVAAGAAAAGFGGARRADETVEAPSGGPRGQGSGIPQTPPPGGDPRFVKGPPSAPGGQVASGGPGSRAGEQPTRAPGLGADTTRSDSTRSDSTRSDATRSDGTARADSNLSGSDLFGSGQQPGRPDQHPAEQRGPEQRGPEQRGPEQRGPEQRGPEQRGPEQRGPEQQRGFASGGPDRRPFVPGGPEQRGPEQRGPEQRGPEQRGFASGGPEQGGPGQPPPTGGRPGAPLGAVPQDSWSTQNPPGGPQQGVQQPVEAQQPDGPDGEAPEERSEPAAAALVATLEDEVIVIDEQPRYHVPGCRALTAQQPIPLPAREAVELGFTPCGWCGPDRTLAGRHPATAR